MSTLLTQARDLTKPLGLAEGVGSLRAGLGVARGFEQSQEQYRTPESVGPLERPNPPRLSPNADLLPPKPMPQSERARIGTLKLDTAVQFNRQSTPPEKVAKRTASRYSISETNTLSTEQIRERLEQMPIGGDKPTWVKFLDLIDAPRNVVAGGIADVFLPEAKRAALERAEFDQFGQVKITGADLLRAMGFENRVVNAVGGFAVDVLTDPITWIGGPIGGLKSVGTRGAVEVSTKGSRVLRSSIKAASTGKTITDDAAREMIDRTLDWGRKARNADGAPLLAPDADAQAISTFLSKTIYGDRGPISELAGKTGLGGLTKGGTLAEDLYKVADDAVVAADGLVDEAAEAATARINATKGFIAKHTDNPGLNLTGGRGGIQVAHIPFTTKTLTLPTQALTGRGLDKLPINIMPGRQSVVQNALSKLSEGNAAGGAAVIRAHSELGEITSIAHNLERLFDSSYDGLREGWPGGGTQVARDAFDAEVEKLAEWSERAAQRLVVDPDDLDTIDDIGDLVATAQMNELAKANLRKAHAMIKQRDEHGAIGRFTLEDVGRARREREAIVKEATAKLGLDPEAAFDDLLDGGSQDSAIYDLIQARKEAAGDRVGKLMDLADEDLDRADSMVDAFHRVADAAAEIELLSGHQMHRAVGSENRMLAEVSRRLIGIDDANLGTMPLASVERAMAGMAPDWASWVSERGRHIATSLGGLGGTQEELRSAGRRIVSGAPDRANVLAANFRDGGGPFSKGIAGIAKDAGVKSGAQYDRLAKLVTARVEDTLRTSAGMPKIAMATSDDAGELTAAGRFYQEAIADGFIADKALQKDIDTLAQETADYLQSIGDDMRLRGEVDDLIDQYIPVRLGTDAEARAKALNKTKAGDSVSPTDRIGQTLNDPSKARMTNIVEFTNKEGVPKRFLLLESEAWRGFDEADLERLALEDPQAAERVAQKVQDIAEFDDLFGADDLVKRDRSRPMTPFDLNEYAQSHALDGLIGGPLVKGNDLFETNMMNLLYHRTQAHHIAQAEAAMKEVVEPFVLLNIRGNEHRAMRAGSEATLRDGTVLKRIGDGRYEHGGTVYRHMSDAKIDPDSLFNPLSILGEDAHGALIPEQLAVGMERMSQVLKPETMPTLLKLADKTTSLFKISTLAHPSWTVGNVIGNTLLVAMDIPELLVNPKKMRNFGRFTKEATKIMYGKNLNRLSGSKTIMVGGQPRRIDELVKLAEESGVMTGGGVHGDLVRQWMGKAHQRAVPVTAGEGRLSGLGGRFRSTRDAERARLSRLRDDGELGRMDTLRANIAGTKTGVLDKVISTWFGANGSVDDGYRLAHYMMMLDEGMDPLAAGQRTRKAMLNFGDMTSFERNWVRPLVPFYAWTRASLPNMMMRTIRQPQHIASAPKLVTALEEALVGQDRVPRWQRPAWLNETLAIQTGTDPETAFLLGTLLPQEGVAQVVGGVAGAAGALGVPTGFNGQDMFDALNWGYSQTGPALKVPTELAFQRESFSGREIGASPGDGDLSLNDYLLGQVRLLRESGIGIERQGGIAKAYEQQGLSGAIGRSLVGGRFSPALTEQSREKAFFFELRDKEAELRKAIKRSDDPEKQEELKLELLGLYNNHIRRGGNPEDVPKWARGDLTNLLGQ